MQFYQTILYYGHEGSIGWYPTEGTKNLGTYLNKDYANYIKKINCSDDNIVKVEDFVEYNGCIYSKTDKFGVNITPEDPTIRKLINDEKYAANEKDREQKLKEERRTNILKKLTPEEIIELGL